MANDDVAITGEKIQTIVRAGSIYVEPYWSGHFAKALEGISVKDLITNVGSGVGRGEPAPVTVAITESVPAENKKDAKKKEESEESDDDMGLDLLE